MAGFIYAGLCVITAIAVYVDARRQGVRREDDPNEHAGPAEWATGCLLLLPVFFPLYVLRRRSLARTP